MALNPKITKDSAGMYWLNWTPDSTAEGYSFTTPSGTSRTFDPTVARTRLGKHLTEPVTASVAALDVIKRSPESASYPPVVTPPPGNLVVAPPVGPFTVLDGNYGSASNPSAFVRTANPVELKKLHAKEYTGYGIGAMQYYPPATQTPGRTLVEDCIAENITSNPPGVMDGTGESGFWFGNPTTARRIFVQNVSWMGIWTGSKCIGTPENPCLFEDVKVKQPDTGSAGIGIYIEHVTKHAVFRRFSIETAVGTGINIEWWYGGAGSSDLVFEDGEIYCPPAGTAWNSYARAGIFADAGTFGCTFRRIRFWGPGNALGLPNKLADPSKPNKVEDCIFENAGRQVYYHDNGIG